MPKKQVTYDVVNSFIIAIKCCHIEEIQHYLQEYDPIIVNRLETQTRQPSLYFSAILIDHEISYQIMKLLLDHGANPHFKDSNQQTVLYYVCKDGKERCLDMLLEHGLSLNEQDGYGQTPLFYVAKDNRLNILPKLLEHKVVVDVNHVDILGSQTALFYAAREGHCEMCKALVEAGCNVAHQDASHKMASHYAKKFGNNETYEYLSFELQNIKDAKKVPVESKQESNNEDQQKLVKRKKRENLSVVTQQVKTSYRLYRADCLGNATELNQQQFEQFINNYPQLEQMLKEPDEIDLTQFEEIKAKESWLKNAHKVLTICWKSKGGYYFHEPVDPSKFNIDDYFEIITEPMDFGTIRRKLTYNVYEGVHQYISDMKLVFDNCVKYNGMENVIAKGAIEIKGIFEENMRQMGYLH